MTSISTVNLKRMVYQTHYLGSVEVYKYVPRSSEAFLNR